MQRDELAARECVRDTVARYAHAGDSGEIAALAACFAPDGILEIKGRSRAEGREAIVALLQPAGATEPTTTTGKPFFQRHVVSNLVFDSVASDRIATRAYFVVFGPDGADHWGRYRDVLVPGEGTWLFAHRLVAVDTTAPGSFLAARWQQ